MWKIKSKARALNSGLLIDNLIKSNKSAPKWCAFCCQLVLDFISEPQANALLTKVTKDGRVHLERDYSLWVRENSVLITIPNIQETDEGDYNLEIFNTRGNAFATFKIIVLPWGLWGAGNKYYGVK